MIELLVSPGEHDTNLIASFASSLSATLGLSLLLFLEHRRSHRSSDLGTLYLVASILCDIILLTSPTETAIHTTVRRLVLVRFLVYVVLLILECFGGRPAFGVFDKSQSPEELGGILNRAFFGWINPILVQGYKNILINKNLPPLSCDLKPGAIRKAMLHAWNQRG